MSNNTMLFLQPAASKHRFITGLAAAVADEPRALDRRSRTTARRRRGERALRFPRMIGWRFRMEISIWRT